jgi:ABC-type branched-subunit amino acid transport system ATPase component
MSATVLEVAGLSRSFGGLRAVRDLDLRLDKGEIHGLIGPNGSGKTTVINLLSGALRPNAGTIRLDGVAIVGLPPYRIARLGVARTFQLVRMLPSLDVIENVIAGMAFRPHGPWGEAARTQGLALLDRVGLAGRAELSPGQLTYIEQKRLELARALALAPRILLLDEWLAGLNPTELAEGIALVRSLRQDGLTILMVEHVMDAIRSLCDRCTVMNAGERIAEGTPAAVLADRAVIRSYLGDPDA